MIKNLRKNKGITLIALVITIIVLLILAGVTINAIIGNESSMEKAKQAQVENEKGNELDLIKLAAVDAMVKGEDGQIKLTDLNASLSGLVTENAEGNSPWTVTGNLGYKYRITAYGEVTLVNSGEVIPNDTVEIGDSISYTTALNGVPLSNWKVFYKTEGYIYIILSNYLPNSAVSDTIKTNYSLRNVDGYYSIASDRKHLIDALINKDNWSELLKGTLNGTAIDYRSSTDINIKAIGSPTLDLYVNSWNAKYPSDKIYTEQTTSAMSDGYYGYYLSTTNNPPTTSDHVVRISNLDELYHPYKTQWFSYGYWLASASAYDVAYALYVGYDGYIGFDYSQPLFALRPVVCLPSSVLQ